MEAMTEAAKKAMGIVKMEVSLGNLVSCIGFMVTGVAAYYSAIARIDIIDINFKRFEKNIEAQIQVISGEMKELSKMVVSDARQDERVDSLARRMERQEIRLDNIERAQKSALQSH